MLHSSLFGQPFGPATFQWQLLRSATAAPQRLFRVILRSMKSKQTINFRFYRAIMFI